jgi:abhydrolase domain-containing protein 12
MPASRIALVGESLGTAVVSGVAAHFGAKANTDGSEPETTPLLRYLNSEAPVDFGCVVLVSSFYDFHTLLPSYRIAGYFPILTPLSWIPPLQRLFLSQVKETWDTKGRLAALVASALQGSGSRRVNIQLIHAVDDGDIPCGLSERSYEYVKKAATDSVAGDGEVVEYESDDRSMWKWSQWANVRIDLKIVRTGGITLPLPDRNTY